MLSRRLVLNGKTIKSTTKKTFPNVVAEWVFERLQIQVADSHRPQVQIPLGTCNYHGEIVTHTHGTAGNAQRLSERERERLKKERERKVVVSAVLAVALN